VTDESPADDFKRVLARWLERDVLPNVIELEHADATSSPTARPPSRASWRWGRT
jgi:hypothetical protein